jgi:ATP-dependent helicase/DNAse subunit B
VRLGPEVAWSPSALETYRACPYHFVTARLLRLETPAIPEEGLGPAALGRIYHTILAAVYSQAGDLPDLEGLMQVFESAANATLDAAPAREGFRPPPGWKYLRQQILDTVRRALPALTSPDLQQVRHEVALGWDAPLTVVDGQGDSFRLRGFADRIDTLADGSLRLVDYKSGGTDLGADALKAGRRIQLPLYAWAVQQQEPPSAIGEGFYFNLRAGESGSLRLSGFPGGVQGAIEKAMGHAWSAVRGARNGDFAPKAPHGGCPDYCPAASFCWRFSPRERA